MTEELYDINNWLTVPGNSIKTITGDGYKAYQYMQGSVEAFCIVEKIDTNGFVIEQTSYETYQDFLNEQNQ